MPSDVGYITSVSDLEYEKRVVFLVRELRDRRAEKGSPTGLCDSFCLDYQ